MNTQNMFIIFLFGLRVLFGFVMGGPNFQGFCRADWPAALALCIPQWPIEMGHSWTKVMRGHRRSLDFAGFPPGSAFVCGTACAQRGCCILAGGLLLGAGECRRPMVGILLRSDDIWPT